MKSQNKVNIIPKDSTIKQLVGKIFPKRNKKDTLFRAAFKEKKYLLELYNALNNSNYVNEDDLEVTTLEDVLYLKMKNDMSFLIADTLNLYEQQSTWNPNMPLRGLFYLARQYENLVNERNDDVYRNRLIKLPMPQFIVLYNGDVDPESYELRLSDAFEEHEGMTPALECIARVVDIRMNHNPEVLGRSTRLQEYSRFIEIYDACKNECKDDKIALKNAIDIGIEEDVLRDILLREKSEVYSMILTEYDEKKHYKNVYQDAYDDGMAAGILSLYHDGTITVEKACEKLNCTEGELKELEEELAKLEKLKKGQTK